MKRLSLLLVASLLLGLFLGGCTPAPAATPAPATPAPADASTPEPAPESTPEPTPEAAPETQWKAALCTDVGGVDDRSFNQSVLEGLKLAEGREGFQIEYLQSTQESEFAQNLDTLLDNGNNLIIGVGFMLAEATLTAATANSGTNYVCIDNFYEAPPANLQGVTFREEQGGFLAGYIAGLTTETNKVGFIGGIEIPPVQRYQYGFEYGAKLANPDCEVFVQYCNSFTDTAVGKSLAIKLYQEDGCDVLFPAAGSCGLGSIEAAKELNKYVLGCDMDQSHLAPDNMLASPLKRCDLATLEMCIQVKNGSFKGGNFTGDITNGMVGIAYNEAVISADVITKTNEALDKVMSGEIVVPDSAS